MTLNEILELIQSGEMDKCRTFFETSCIVKNLSDIVSQIDPFNHVINDKSKRQDKSVDTGTTAEDGTFTKTGTRIIPVARIALPIQKKIVVTASAFLGTPAIEGTPKNSDEEKIMAGISRVWDRNKLDYSFRDISKKTMAERHCAELWKLKTADADYWDGTGIKSEFKLKMQVLSYTYGDSLFPVYDADRDMIAFGHGYKTVGDDSRDIEHFDIYTDTEIYLSKKVDGFWNYGVASGDEILYTTAFGSIKNMIGKIPIIYYHQHIVEWQDVQVLIDRLETIKSNHADTNDYSGSPILKISGDVVGAPDKGEQGKAVQLKDGGDISYLTFDGAPESLKMEIDGLKQDIYGYTHTPDISFENMKGLGAFSGTALDTFFFDARLKATDKEQIFGEGVQRRINYIKAALSVLDTKLKPGLTIQLKPKFTFVGPRDVAGMLTDIKTALDAGIISKETAIALNPLVDDIEGEAVRIKQEGTKTEKPAEAGL